MTTKEEVNHPSRYNAGAVECIDAIESALTPDEYRGFIKGTVMRYAWREKHKGGNQDLAKAQWYIARLLAIKPEELAPPKEAELSGVVAYYGEQRAKRDMAVAKAVRDWYADRFPGVRGAMEDEFLADIISRVKS